MFYMGYSASWQPPSFFLEWEAANTPTTSMAPTTSAYTHKLCLMTRVLNVPRSLAEWVEYHHALGVGHFFLVDDCSTDEGKTAQVLDTYQEIGLVSRYSSQEVPHYSTCDAHQPNENKLFSFLYHQAKASEHRCEWLGVFDVDEYMTLQEHMADPSNRPTPSELLYAVLDTLPLPVLHMPWVLMGSDDHRDKPPGLLIEGSQSGSYHAWMLKTMAKTEVLQDWVFSHWPVVNNELTEREKQLNVPGQEEAGKEHLRQVPAPFIHLQELTQRNWLFDEESYILPNSTCRAPVSPVFLKHYKYRSLEEFKHHRGRSRVQPDGQHSDSFNNLEDSWSRGSNPSEFTETCKHAYYNGFTSFMAALTTTALQDRMATWHAAHKDGPAFPPVQEWIL